MGSQAHWDRVYETKAPDQVSWFRPHLDVSLELITSVLQDREAGIIDVGGGESTLVDDLIEQGYRNVTVLDISPRAIAVTKERLGERAGLAQWIVGDVASVELPPRAYAVWHDRAVFHFLTRQEDRAAYVAQVARAVRPGGHVIVGAFAPEGPEKCSGLEVRRYGEEALHEEFGAGFRLVESRREMHRTPAGIEQPFVYCFCAVERDML